MFFKNKFFKNKSKDIAKQRLTMVLAYERKCLAPIHSLRDDLIAVFSKYYQFDLKNLEVELDNEDCFKISLCFLMQTFYKKT